MGTHRAQNRAPRAHNSQHCGSVGWVRVCRALGGAPQPSAGLVLAPTAALAPIPTTIYGPELSKRVNPSAQV